MKKITCIDCDEQFEGETKEQAMMAMHPHYMEAHKDVMAVQMKKRRRLGLKS